MVTTSTTGNIRPTAAHRVVVLGGTGPRLWQQIARERWIYLFILPGALYFLVFEYLPLLGNIIAFQDFSPFLGIRDSPFIGLENFGRLLTDTDFRVALVNTVQIELLQLVFAFPAPLVLALVLHSILNGPLRRTMQSVAYRTSCRGSLSSPSGSRSLAELALSTSCCATRAWMRST